jgi:hypothetical protein
VAWRDAAIPLARYLRIAAVAAVPALVVYAAWRWYVSVELVRVPGAEATIMPFDLWNVAAIPRILWGMTVVASKKIAFFVPMAIACGFAVRALVKGARSEFDRVAILTATVFVAYNVFLLFIYVAHFALPNALSVVSYWRYNIDIGSVAIVFITSGVLTLWSRYGSFDRYPRWAAPVAIALVVALPIALADKVRFDLEPPKPHYLAVAKDLRAMGLAAARIRLLDPNGTGEAGVITRYLLSNRGYGWMSGFQNTSADAIAIFLKDVQPGEHLLVHSTSRTVSDALGHALDPRRSYLFRRDGGSWTLIKEWPKPANHPW